MDFPLSSVLANIFLEDFEENALTDSSLSAKLWKRFVDDILAIWCRREEQLDCYPEYLNKIHPSNEFTMELENDEHFQLPFVDIMITK